MLVCWLFATASALAPPAAATSGPIAPAPPWAPLAIVPSADYPTLAGNGKPVDESGEALAALDGVADAAAEPEGIGPRAPYGLATFGRDVASAPWVLGAMTGIVIVPRIYRRAKSSSDSFHFHSEGWFGRDTSSLGMDKLLHAWKTYVITDIAQSAIARRTGDESAAAISAGVFGLGLMTLAEVNDGFSKTTGFSNEDEVVQVAGAGLSVVRNLVPGLRDTLDYRLSIRPKLNGELDDTRGRADNSKYLLALQLAGIRRLARTPLRFVEFHLGYYARGFTQQERLQGDPLRRHIFVGVGFNVQQLFAARPRGTPERLAKGALDYIQLPYTAVEF